MFFDLFGIIYEMFKIRLLKWQVICLLITSLIFSGRAFAVDESASSLQPLSIEQQNISAQGNGPIDSSQSSENITIESDQSGETSATLFSPPPGTIYSRDIIINEVLPAPKTAFTKEYVELYNKGIADIDLTGWWIDDIEGGGKSPTELNLTNFPAMVSFILMPNSFIVFEFVNVFNNTGDSVRLIDPNLEVADKIDYTKTKEDQSYSLIGLEWLWTTPSPMAINIAPVEEKTEIITLVEKNIEQVKNLPDGDLVLTKGTVTVLPGAFSTQYFYIEDGSSGIQIYSYYKNFPTLMEGDIVTVTGELSTASGERRIKIDKLDKIKVISAGSVLLPQSIELSSIGIANLGRYIQISGAIATTSGDEFTIIGADNLKIIIKDDTKIQKPKMKKGDKVVVSGVLTIYGETFRILPIHENDVKIVTSDELPLVGPDMLIYFDLNLVLYIIFVLWNILLKAKRRLKVSHELSRFLQRRAMFLLCLETWAVEKRPLPKGLLGVSA